MRKTILILAVLFAILLVGKGHAAMTYYENPDSYSFYGAWVTSGGNNTEDGVWTTYDRLNGCSGTGLNETYTKEVGATGGIYYTALNGYGNGSYNSLGNINIVPSSCWNADPSQVTFRIELYCNPYNEQIGVFCKNSTGMQHFASSGTGLSDGYYIYETGLEENITSSSTSCNDTDYTGTYPSLNYTVQGTLTATNITPRTDYCNLNFVLEYACDNSTTFHPVPVQFDCTSIGKICSNGACVASNITPPSSIGTSWQQFTTTGYQNTNTTFNHLLMSYPQLSAPITSECSPDTYGQAGFLVDSIYRYLWIVKSSYLDLLDSHCNLIDEIDIGGVLEGYPRIINYDGDTYPNILFAVRNATDVTVRGYEYNGISLFKDKEISLNAQNCEGIACDTTFNKCAMYCDAGTYSDGNIKDIDLSTSSYVDVNATTTMGAYNFNSANRYWNLLVNFGYVNPQALQGVAADDLDKDNKAEALFYNLKYGYWKVGVFEMATGTLQNVYTPSQLDPYPSSGGGHYIKYVFAPYTIGQIGDINSYPEIFEDYQEEHTSWNFRSAQRVLDRNFNVISIQKDCASPWNDICPTTVFSNYVTGDYTDEGFYEFCIILDQILRCYDKNSAMLFNCTMQNIDTNYPLPMTMIERNGLASNSYFVTNMGIYRNDCHRDYNFGLNGSSSPKGTFIPADVSGDGKIDLLYSDSAKSIIFTTSTAPLTQLDSCYNTTGSFFPHEYNIDPEIDFSDIVTEDFDMVVYSDANLEKEFVYRDTTSSLNKINYKLQWWSDGGSNYLQYTFKDGNTTVGDSICTNCWQAGVSHHYQIISYHQNLENAQFYNVTSHTFQVITPNTFSVKIDDAATIYNLGMYDTLNPSHNNIFQEIKFIWDSGKVCVDNYVLTEGAPAPTNESLGCDYNQPTYSYPIIWLDPFQYPDAITYHGWYGYPFVVADAPFGHCNEVFYDNSKYTGAIGHQLAYNFDKDSDFTWDYFGYSPTGIDEFQLCGAGAYFNMKDSLNRSAVFLQFSGDLNDDNTCNISALIGGEYVPVGKWDGVSFQSYKVHLNFAQKTFDFYYTDKDHLISYQVGCTNCSFANENVTSIRNIEWHPLFSETNWGFFLDSIKLQQTEGVPIIDQNNFCDFDGCIYKDTFSYTDSIRNHGWYMVNITPSSGQACWANTDGYEMSHDFPTFRETDGEGIITLQFRARFFPPTGLGTLSDTVTFGGLTLFFRSDSVSMVGSQIGSFSDDSHTFTLIEYLTTNKFDLYVDGVKVGNQLVIPETTDEIHKVTFFAPNADYSICIDWVTVQVGSVEAVPSGGDFSTDTGIPASQLESCWLKNGSFDWERCCTADELADKSFLCPTKATGLYFLSNLTVFILHNVIYFVILAIIFVLVTPYIIPRVRS